MVAGTKKEPNFQYNNYQQKSYFNNQQSGYQPRNNQQGSYQPQQNPRHGFNNKGQHSSQQQANPSTSTPQVSSTDALLKQILESQTRSEKHVGYKLKNLHSKIDGSYNELNNKFRTLENQFAAMNIQQNRQQGSLPGKSEQNPKETMKAITLRSGKELPQRALTKDAEKQGEGVAINIDDEVVIVDEKINDEILEKIVEAKGKGKVGEEKKTVKDGEVVAPASENSFVPPPYEPKLKSDAVYSGDHDRGSRTDDKQTRKELKALQDKIDILIADKATQEQLHFVGNPNKEATPVVQEVDGLEGQEELCFINNNGSWYKKEPNFQYNNYQQRSYPNNQQSGYQPRNNQQGSYQPQQNPPPGFNNKGQQPAQLQPTTSTSTPQVSSTDALLKQILESRTRSEKHVGYELKNLHSKIDGSYNEFNNNLLPSTEQVPSSFIFTNCEKLEHVAMNEIMCYAHNKSRLISDALNRQNKFNHKASGAVIKPELPRHWSESGFSNCDVGGLSEAGNEQCTVKSTHVFIGFTSWLNINKCREVGLKEGCIPARASIEFKVTDGTCEAANCEVLKCGFSFVCESDNGSWNANADANPMIYESNNGALEANTEATPVIVESNTGSSDANVVANPVVEGEIQGGGRFLGLLRRRAWFLNL
ncbi:hypothetical protein F2Q69_00055312 [Brassica cretica]|uniref:Uncharacterized protein n=1 Tax=Brassica cretica TaxID=69181 RepID=A0A8S9N379_BRACR|nr:hypothetical protein F2Q69_00055312 [Brassica cretica]